MIWEQLPKPFFALAPMDDVTDTVFRRIIAGTAAPDVFFTEFASVDGYMSEGRHAVEQKLTFTDSETPLIAQIWGLKPENYQTATEQLAGRGYSGIDINMGCPVPKVIKNGACSALIKNRPLAADIIAATKAGAGKLPVSVKTRIGFNKIDLSWIEFLLQQDIAALTVHGRTTKEQSKVPMHWEVFDEIVAMRNKIAPQTILIGNGDILTRQQGMQKAEEYGLDGLMIGRGIFQDPFVFAEDSPWSDMPTEDKLGLYQKHIQLFADTWGPDKNPAVLKKFCKVYVSGFDGASELRSAVMEQDNAPDLLKLLQEA